MEHYDLLLKELGFELKGKKKMLSNLKELLEEPRYSNLTPKEVFAIHKYYGTDEYVSKRKQTALIISSIYKLEFLVPQCYIQYGRKGLENPGLLPCTQVTRTLLQAKLDKIPRPSDSLMRNIQLEDLRKAAFVPDRKDAHTLFTALKQANIHNLYELSQKTMDDICQIRGIGQVSVHHLKQMLSHFSIQLPEVEKSLSPKEVIAAVRRGKKIDRPSDEVLQSITLEMLYQTDREKFRYLSPAIQSQVPTLYHLTQYSREELQNLRCIGQNRLQQILDLLELLSVTAPPEQSMNEREKVLDAIRTKKTIARPSDEILKSIPATEIDAVWMRMTGNTLSRAGETLYDIAQKTPEELCVLRGYGQSKARTIMTMLRYISCEQKEEPVLPDFDAEFLAVKEKTYALKKQNEEQKKQENEQEYAEPVLLDDEPGYWIVQRREDVCEPPYFFSGREQELEMHLTRIIEEDIVSHICAMKDSGNQYDIKVFAKNGSVIGEYLVNGVATVRYTAFRLETLLDVTDIQFTKAQDIKKTSLQYARTKEIPPFLQMKDKRLQQRLLEALLRLGARTRKEVL